MNEEAKLSDFKRVATKEALGIKFGALLELSEKATVRPVHFHPGQLEAGAYPTTLIPCARSLVSSVSC